MDGPDSDTGNNQTASRITRVNLFRRGMLPSAGVCDVFLYLSAKMLE